MVALLFVYKVCWILFDNWLSALLDSLNSRFFIVQSYCSRSTRLRSTINIVYLPNTPKWDILVNSLSILVFITNRNANIWDTNNSTTAHEKFRRCDPKLIVVLCQPVAKQKRKQLIEKFVKLLKRFDVESTPVLSTLRRKSYVFYILICRCLIAFEFKIRRFVSLRYFTEMRWSAFLCFMRRFARKQRKLWRILDVLYLNFNLTLLWKFDSSIVDQFLGNCKSLKSVAISTICM